MISARRRVAVMALAFILVFVPAAITAADDGTDKPDADSQTATAVGPDSATLQARVRPRGLLTTYHFEYGTTNEYGQSTPDQSAGLGLEWSSVAKQVSGLSPSTKYHYRIVAVNPLGTATGGDQSFTTAAPDGTPAPTTSADDTGSDSSGSGNSGSGSSGSDSSGSDDRGGNGSGENSDHAGSGSDHSTEPELGHTVGVQPADGVVKIRKPHDKNFGAVDPDGTVPTGTVVDARHGKILLTTEVSPGKTQTGTFWGGMFEVRQSASDHGYVDLHLRGRKASCPAKHKRAAASAKRRRGSSLWGSDRHGRFRTHGRTSVATVRGTTWRTSERCHGTLTFVREGAVVVRGDDGRRVTVHAGHAYLAHARQR
jgi:hypothetical protein